MTRAFPAKILLFGEYGLIENSKGLTIPYGAFQGGWKYHPQGQVDEELQNYAVYLHGILGTYLDTELLQEDIKQGLYFDSSIPQGYGIGSSGALVAATYDRFAFDQIPATQCLENGKVIELRKVFAMMENYFHGASSGIDPLLSYLNTPLLIESLNEMSKITLPVFKDNTIGVFLLDTETASKTTPMIDVFKHKMQDKEFADKMQREFIPCNDLCIDAFIDNKQDIFFNHMKELSSWSLKYLQPMIPESLHDIWQAGLQNDTYYLKLCGSGGGGYMLAFMRDKNDIANHMTGYNVQDVLHHNI